MSSSNTKDQLVQDIYSDSNKGKFLRFLFADAYQLTRDITDDAREAAKYFSVLTMLVQVAENGDQNDYHRALNSQKQELNEGLFDLAPADELYDVYKYAVNYIGDIQAKLPQIVQGLFEPNFNQTVTDYMGIPQPPSISPNIVG